MPSRYVYFFAGNIDLNVIKSYYMDHRGEGAAPSTEIVTFHEALRRRLSDCGLSEEQVFEPSAGLDEADMEGPGLYLGFDGSERESILGQMEAFTLANQMNVGTYDTVEEGDGWDSTRHYFEELREADS